jgi:hypothetical protein
MYHLLIERISTVTIEFLQYRARVQIGLNQAGIERVVEQTGLFTSLLSLFRFSFCFDHQTRTQNTLSALSLNHAHFHHFLPSVLLFSILSSTLESWEPWQEWGLDFLLEALHKGGFQELKP